MPGAAAPPDVQPATLLQLLTVADLAAEVLSHCDVATLRSLRLVCRDACVAVGPCIATARIVGKHAFGFGRCDAIVRVRAGDLALLRSTPRLRGLVVQCTSHEAALALATSPLPLLAELTLRLGPAVALTQPGALGQLCLPTLRTLSAASQGLGPAAASALARAHLPSLRTLLLPFNDLGCEGAAALSTGEWGQLRHLDVAKCGIGAAGFVALAACGSSGSGGSDGDGTAGGGGGDSGTGDGCSSSGSGIAGTGGACVIGMQNQYQRQPVALSTLAFESTATAARTGPASSKGSIARWPRLERLHAACNHRMGDAGAAALAAASAWPLQELDVSQCGIGQAGVVALCTGSGGSRWVLRWLGLNNCDLEGGSSVPAGGEANGMGGGAWGAGAAGAPHAGQGAGLGFQGVGEDGVAGHAHAVGATAGGAPGDQRLLARSRSDPVAAVINAATGRWPLRVLGLASSVLSQAQLSRLVQALLDCQLEC